MKKLIIEIKKSAKRSIFESFDSRFTFYRCSFLVFGRSLEQSQLFEFVVERHAVVWRQTVSHDRFPVFPGRISFVFLPVVYRIFLGDPHHVVVAVGFGQYRGRSDGRIRRVAFDDATVRNIQRCPEPVSVDQQQLRFHRQSFDGAGHRRERSVQDVDPVDFL